MDSAAYRTHAVIDDATHQTADAATGHVTDAATAHMSYAEALQVIKGAMSPKVDAATVNMA